MLLALLFLQHFSCVQELFCQLNTSYSDEPAKETNNLDNSPGQQSSVVETDRTQSLSSSNPQDDRTDLHSDGKLSNFQPVGYPLEKLVRLGGLNDNND